MFLSFPEPFLKATKSIPLGEREAFGRETTAPWQGMENLEIMDERRGPFALPNSG